MTTVEVQAGICGYTAKVEVQSIDRDHVRVIIVSECRQITAMNPDLKGLNWRNGLLRLDRSPVYRSARRNIRHAGCPIPSAVLKAIEVELGIALPHDVHMTFEASQ